jgi:hypothetical protein
MVQGVGFGVGAVLCWFMRARMSLFCNVCLGLRFIVLAFWDVAVVSWFMSSVVR